MRQRKPKQDKTNRTCIYAQKFSSTTKKEQTGKEEEDKWQTHELDAKKVLKVWDAEMDLIRT